MDKRNKKDKPKLRKEDIGIPVNFVHVKHVGFGPQKSIQSATVSPTFENFDGFFNEQNIRRSETSKGNKENRVSTKSSHYQVPFSSMSNLSIVGKRDSGEEQSGRTANAKFAKLKSKTNALSGSLLNLSFLPFSKISSNEKSRRYDSPSKITKRMSLGLGFQGNDGPSLSAPLQNRSSAGPSVSPHQTRQPRRRSTSFHGESDIPDYSEVFNGGTQNPNSGREPMSLNLNKKPKMVSQSSYPSPPMSPSYDELPPPPEEIFSFHPDPTPLTPDSPGILPPPPMSELIPRKVSLPNMSGDGEFKFPQSPTSPSFFMRKLSAIPDTPNYSSNEAFPSLPSPSGLPPPLPTSPPPPLTSANSRIGYKNFPVKSKLIRVNAPTLPPLSVPLVRPSTPSPGTPSTWPLQPGVPILSSFQPHSANPSGTSKQRSNNASPIELGDLTVENIQKVCNADSKLIDASHVEPLTKLFQCRLPLNQWPVMMNQLFSKPSDCVMEDPDLSGMYGDLIRSTLEIWLKLRGGTATLEEIVSKFELAQAELNICKDSCDITKL